MIVLVCLNIDMVSRNKQLKKLKCVSLGATMIKKKRSRRKPTLTSVKNKAWKVFSEYIRRRHADDDGGVRCV